MNEYFGQDDEFLLVSSVLMVLSILHWLWLIAMGSIAAWVWTKTRLAGALIAEAGFAIVAVSKLVGVAWPMVGIFPSAAGQTEPDFADVGQYMYPTVAFEVFGTIGYVVAFLGFAYASKRLVMGWLDRSQLTQVRANP